MAFELETERLLLRDMAFSDMDELLHVFGDAENMRFYPKLFDRERMQEWIEWNLRNYDQYGFGLWAVVLKQTNEVIGDCGLVPQVVDGISEIEMGYHIRRDLQGQGLATEAAQACRKYAFQELGRDKVISIIAPENFPSRRVAEKNGMSLMKETVWRDKRVCIYGC